MKYLIIVLLSLFLSCNKNDNEQTMVDTSIEISIKDANGLDLLNPDNINSFQENDIKIYYLINGEMVEYYAPELDNSKGFKIYQHQTEYRISIYPNDTETELYPITYVEWNNSLVDTLKCDFMRGSNSLVCSKVWFNNELVYSSNEAERFFEILK